MKKTIIALLALGGLAAAADTQILNLSATTTVGNLTYNAETGYITTAAATDLYKVSEGKAETNVILTLNLSEAMAVTGTTKIIELDYNGNADVSLLATTGGLVGGWNGSPYGGNAVSWDTLASNSTVMTGKGGDKYITLMVSQWQNGGINFLVNTGESRIISTPALGSSNINSMERLYVNNALVEAIEVTPEWKGTDATRQADTAAFHAVVKPMLSIPEPTTATLSLLALAGLAARRRRK